MSASPPPNSIAQSKADYAKRTGTYLIDNAMKRVPAGAYVGPGGVIVQAETHQKAQQKLAQQAKDKTAQEQHTKQVTEHKAATETQKRKAYVAALERQKAQEQQKKPAPYAPITPTPIKPTPLTRESVREGLGLRAEKTTKTIEHPGSTEGLEPMNIELMPQENRTLTRGEQIGEKIQEKGDILQEKAGGYDSFAGGFVGRSVQNVRSIVENPGTTAAITGIAILASQTPQGRVAVGAVAGVSIAKTTIDHGFAAGAADIALILGAGKVIKSAGGSRIIKGITSKRTTSPKTILGTSRGESRLKDIPIAEGLSSGVGRSTVKRGSTIVSTNIKETTQFIETPSGTPSISKGIGTRTTISAPNQKVLSVKLGRKELRIVGSKPTPELISREPVSTSVKTLTTPPPTLPGISRFKTEIKTKVDSEVKTGRYEGSIKTVMKYPTKKGQIIQTDSVTGRTTPGDPKSLELNLGGEAFKIPKKLSVPFRIEPKAIQPKKSPVSSKKGDILRIYDKKTPSTSEGKSIIRSSETRTSPASSSGPQKLSLITESKPENAALYDKPVPSFAGFSSQILGMEKINAISSAGAGKTGRIFPISSRNTGGAVKQDDFMLEISGASEKNVSILQTGQKISTPTKTTPAIQPRTPTENTLQSPKTRTMQFTSSKPKQDIYTIQSEKPSKKQALTPKTRIIPETRPPSTPRRPPHIPRTPGFSGSLDSKARQSFSIAPKSTRSSKRKRDFNPLADWLSVTQTAARNFGTKPLHQAPTEKVKEKYRLALAANPTGFRFPTYQQTKGKEKKARPLI